MTIGYQTIIKATEMVSRQLRDYQPSIDEAYTRTEGALSVTLKVDFVPGPGSSVKITSNIGFVMDRVKDHMKATVDEKQLQMFVDEKQLQAEAALKEAADTKIEGDKPKK